MGDWRDDWNTEKKKLDKAKIHTSIFKEDLGAKCDNYEKALKQFEKRRGELTRNDPKMTQLRSDLTTASGNLAKAAAKYEDLMRYLSDRAVDATQKAVCVSATNFLFKLLSDINNTRKLA